MHEETKKSIKLLINSNRQKIKAPEAKQALKNNLNLLKTIKERDIKIIIKLLQRLQNQNNELSPFVKDLKNKISDITAETHLCATYLLLCYVLQTWQSIYLLAKNGFYSQVLILIRVIKESLMLCDNFILEYKNNNKESLNKWFSGVIISHAVGRKSVSRFIDEYGNFPNLDTKQLQSHIYQMESLFPHSSYTSMLENVSPFTENFDFEGYTGFRRMESALKYAIGTMGTFAITLKSVYLFLLQDHIKYDKIDRILTKYDNNLNKKNVSEKIQKTFKKTTK